MFIFYNLKEEDKKLREELEKFKLNYLEEENKNKQLAKDLNTVIDQVQNLKVSYLAFIFLFQLFGVNQK